MVAILEKSDAAQGFEQIIDFLSGSYIQHALTMNPHVYISFIKQFWNTVVVKRSGDVTRLQALVDKKMIVITEEMVREILQLDDAEGQRFNFSKYIFESLIRNVDSPSKFYMYPRFLQLIIQSNIADLSKHTNRYISPVLTQKVFANMRRVGKGFSGVPAQDDVVQEHVTEEIADDVVQPTPTSPLPSSPVLDTCSTLVLRVEGLETANAAQQLEIIKLKARVKKLERLNKGRKSVDMETDEGIELEVDQENCAEVEGRQADTQEEIYNIDLDHSSKVAAASTPILVTITAAKPKVLKIAAAALTVSTKKRKGVIIRDPEEELHTKTPAETLTVKDKGKGILIEDPKPMKKKDQVEIDVEYARKLQEELNKEHDEAYKNIDWNAAFDHVQAKETQYIKRYHGFKKKPQSKSEARKNMISYLRNTEGYKMEFFKGLKYDDMLPIFQAKFDANMRLLFKTREEMEAEDEEIIKSINETPAKNAAKRRRLHEQAKEDADLKKQLKVVVDEDDDVFIEATPIGRKVPVVNYEIVMINNKPRYKIIRADDTHQLYTSFITLLKNFDREDLEDLWRIVKARFSTSKPTNFSDDYLLSTLKTMFEKTDGQDAI
nr:hypothetical protein [Tanacetum cinerariifolium]